MSLIQMTAYSTKHVYLGVALVLLLTPTSPCVNVHIKESLICSYLFSERFINLSTKLWTLAKQGFQPLTEPNLFALPTELSCLDHSLYFSFKKNSNLSKIFYILCRKYCWQNIVTACIPLAEKKNTKCIT